MPVPVKHFACSFRCGFVRSKISVVIDHETRCFSNPARRACRTCGNYEPPTQEDEVDCYMDNLQEPTKQNNLGLRVNCNVWKGDTA